MKKVVFISLAVVLAAAIAGGIFYFSVLRDGSAKASQAEIPTAVVERGNLTATISTNGNVTLSEQQKLSFGVSGTIKEVKVENGSVVKKGDIIALLDTISLERAIVQAQANLEAAEINLKKTQNLYKASDIMRAESAVFSARSALKEAQQSLDDYITLYDATDLRLAEADLRNAKLNLETALLDQKLNLRIQGQSVKKSYEQEIQEASVARERARLAYRDLIWRVYKVESLIPDTEYHLKLNPMKMGFIAVEAFDKNVEDAYWNWIDADISYQKLIAEEYKNKQSLQNNVDKAKDAINRAEQKLADIKEWPKASEIEIRKARIESAKQTIDKAEADLADIKAGADPLDIALKQNQIDQNKISLDIAKENLDKAKLLAPFDGVIFNLTAEPNQSVSAGTIVMQIVNPSTMRIDVYIDEVDIARVRGGQEADVTFDALPGIALPGKITNVSYVATKQSGVTNFLTYIGLDMSRPMRERPAGSAGVGQRSPGTGQQGPRTGQVSGKAAQGKTGSMAKPGKPAQSKTGSMDKPGKPAQDAAVAASGAATSRPEQPAGAGGTTTGRQRPILRDGMTALVTISTEKREGVLVLPNRAIVSQAGNRIVKVKVGDKVEERQVRTGLTDGSKTEIMSGVEEGETVIIAQQQVRTSPAKPGGGLMPGKIGF